MGEDLGHFWKVDSMAGRHRAVSTRGMGLRGLPLAAAIPVAATVSFAGMGNAQAAPVPVVEAGDLAGGVAGARVGGIAQDGAVAFVPDTAASAPVVEPFEVPAVQAIPQAETVAVATPIGDPIENATVIGSTAGQVIGGVVGAVAGGAIGSLLAAPTAGLAIPIGVVGGGVAGVFVGYYAGSFLGGLVGQAAPQIIPNVLP
ncbi:hypothetical protein [Nocardia sp. NPDC020380]|uniref:hypothetical protein n=1 Tax=Nocardia sp. NPDC020380 TaxID=3364309 RepID=UPI0037B091CC